MNNNIYIYQGHIFFKMSSVRPLKKQSTYTVYLEYHSVRPLVRVGTPTPSPASECVPLGSRNQRGGHTRQRSPNSDERRKSLALCLLCASRSSHSTSPHPSPPPPPTLGQRGNSRTYTYVEVSGHNLESSQTWGFYLRFLPFYRMLFSKLEFSSLIDCFVWISDFCQVFLLCLHL
jgi:hypothetical protein